MILELDEPLKNGVYKFTLDKHKVVYLGGVEVTDCNPTYTNDFNDYYRDFVPFIQKFLDEDFKVEEIIGDDNDSTFKVTKVTINFLGF